MRNRSKQQLVNKSGPETIIVRDTWGNNWMKAPIPGHQEWNKGCKGRQRILAKARRHTKGNKGRHQCGETNERTNPLIPWADTSIFWYNAVGVWEKHFQICSWTLVALRDPHNKTKTKKRETPSSPAVPGSKIAMSGRFPNPVPPILISQQCIDKPIAIRIGSKQGLAPRPNSSKSWVPRMSSIPKSRNRERKAGSGWLFVGTILWGILMFSFPASRLSKLKDPTFNFYMKASNCLQESHNFETSQEWLNG